MLCQALHSFPGAGLALNGCRVTDAFLSSQAAEHWLEFAERVKNGGDFLLNVLRRSAGGPHTFSILFKFAHCALMLKYPTL